MDLVKYLKCVFLVYFSNFDESFDYIKDKVKLSQAFLMSCVFLVLYNVVYILINFMYTSTYLSLVSITLLISILVSIIVIPIGLFLSSGYLHLFLKLFGAKGKFLDGTLKYVSNISIPQTIFSLIVIMPFVYLLNFMYEFELVLTIILLCISLAFGIWNIFIYIKGFSKIHQISKTRVFLSILTSIFVTLLIMILFVTLIFVFIGSSIF